MEDSYKYSGYISSLRIQRLLIWALDMS